MITADKARKIKLNVFSKLRYIIYLFLLNLYIKRMLQRVNILYCLMSIFYLEYFTGNGILKI
ncbi:hypothetical protein [Brachyspira hyodysenteriae]|uniref:hypothetical protein n=1 Tax=Brachyspira hyodysenteriae TaxID=159 RepID=UPI0022CDE3C4|nr:hypothetical protein [Brachyspira hyodysenteriae]MCZ9889001.1 hypothetical protein [Brachyspira hyodysenteriae]